MYAIRSYYADRNEPIGRAQLQPVDLGDVALVLRETDADVDLVRRVIGTVFADLDAGRDELYGRTDRRDVSSEPTGLLTVDREVPFDAG